MAKVPGTIKQPFYRPPSFDGNPDESHHDQLARMFKNHSLPKKIASLLLFSMIWQIWQIYARVTCLEVHEGLCTRLAANVDGVVRVGESVELSGRTLSVGTHVLKVEPVSNIEGAREEGALADEIDAITSGTPDRILDAISDRALLGGVGVVEGLAIGVEDLGNGVLVVEHDAREVAIDTVVDVSHVAGGLGRGVIDGATSDDVASNSEGCSNIEAARLGNNVNAASSREELGQGIIEDRSHGLKGLSREASADVEDLQVEIVGTSLLEDGVGVDDGLAEGRRVRGARSHMEAHADDVEAKLLGQGEEALGGVHGSTKLHAEAAQARRVVRHDAEEELGAREQLGDLVELISIVKGHLLDTNRLDIADVGVGLAGLGIDDVVGAGTEAKDLFNLSLGGAIKASAEGRKELEHLGVRVTLDGIEWLDAGEVPLPAEVLAVNLAKVCDKEGVFLAGVAELMVDGAHALAEGLADQLLRIESNIVLKSTQILGFLLYNMIMDDILDVIVEDSRCHNHIPGKVWGVRDVENQSNSYSEEENLKIVL